MAKGPKSFFSLKGRVKSFSLVRKLARTVPGFGALAGGVRQSKQAGAAAGPWSMLVFGVPPELRQDVDRAFPEIRKLFVARNADERVVNAEFNALGHKAVLCWGAMPPLSLSRLIRKSPEVRVAYIYSGPFDIPGIDGSLRSYVLDWSGLYVNMRRGCDLEAICNAFPFEDHPSLVKACDEMCEQLLAPSAEPDNSVAVIVQDRTDQEFAFGANNDTTPAELIALARKENPDVPIHVVASMLPDQLDILEQQLPTDVKLANKDETVDILCQAKHVYTCNASLGVLAVLARRPVTVLAPCFYAGYGLTDDRCETPRRNRKISREQLATTMFALYLRWLDDEGSLRFPKIESPTEDSADVSTEADIVGAPPVQQSYQTTA